MRKSVRRVILALVLAALVASGARIRMLPGCSAAENASLSAENALETAIRLSSAAELAQKNGTAARIELAENDEFSAPSGVRIEGNVISITFPGIYRVSGCLTEGQLNVNCDGSVTLILDGVEISNTADAAIRISNADHALIYLPEGRENRVISGVEREIAAAGADTDAENASGAAIYSRDDLSFAGNGRLTVEGYINNAAATTDCLTVLGGDIRLTAVNNGLKGKDSVAVLGGSLMICSGNDGIKSNNDEDAGCGNVEIRGGEIVITSFGDGIQAENDLTIGGGAITVTAGDTSALEAYVSARPEEGTDNAVPPAQPGEGTGSAANDVTPPEHPEEGTGGAADGAAPPARPEEGTDNAVPPAQPGEGTGSTADDETPPLRPEEETDSATDGAAPPARPEEKTGSAADGTAPPARPEETTGSAADSVAPPARPGEGTGSAADGAAPPARPEEKTDSAADGAAPPARPGEGTGSAADGAAPPARPGEGTGSAANGAAAPARPGEEIENTGTPGETRPAFPNGAESGFPGGWGNAARSGFGTDGEMPTDENRRGRNSADFPGGAFDARGGFASPGDRNPNADADAEAGAKGLKCGENLSVSGGKITVRSVDDCIHANGSITVTGGEMLLTTGDDGMHADGTLNVSGGQITVSASYEGIEANFIVLSGGTVSVTASDDGINANGQSASPFVGMNGAGFPFENTPAESGALPALIIRGGSIYVNAGGDGLDSNGDLIIEGGMTVVDGPTNDGNGALDSGAENGGVIVCNGGTILAVGAAGMAETFGNDSAQCSFMVNFPATIAAGTTVAVRDEDGNLLFEHVSAKAFRSVVFGNPDVSIGKTYTVSAGNQTVSVDVEGVSNGNASGRPNGGGFR